MRFLLVLITLWSLGALADNTPKVAYFDEAAELYWSNDLGMMSYKSALHACEELNLMNKIWRLPEASEFAEAEENRIRSKMDFKNSWWWAQANHHYFAHLFNGYTGQVDGQMDYHRKTLRALVRCVAQ